MPISILYLPLLAPFALGLLFFVILIVEWGRFRHPMIQGLFRRFFGFMMRKEESRMITGATWIILSAFLCALFFFNKPYIPFMALTMFILGDSAAAIVGQTMGRVKWGKKTLEGSFACLTMCLILCYAVFPFIPQMDKKFLHPAVIWVSSLVVTFFELVPLRVGDYRINDNLSVPLIASFVLYLLEGMVRI
ncbi:MAG: hypothetical protein N2572_08505 [Syntrophales bacterium]|nr:hypothetical protein [Syntrophales bacterium]